VALRLCVRLRLQRQHHDRHGLGQRRPARKGGLAWDSNPTSDYLNDPLNADLDLYVYGPNQAQYSVSWDNSYEVVDFTAAASGNFQIKIHKFRFDGAHEFVGAVWSLS
jgi:hypothetical protein